MTRTTTIRKRLAAIEARLYPHGTDADPRVVVVVAAMNEAFRLVLKRTGSKDMAARGASGRGAAVAAAIRMGQSVPAPMTRRGLLTVEGAAVFDRLLDQVDGFAPRLYTPVSIPGTDGKVPRFGKQNNVQIGSPYLKERRGQEPDETRRLPA